MKKFMFIITLFSMMPAYAMKQDKEIIWCEFPDHSVSVIKNEENGLELSINKLKINDKWWYRLYFAKVTYNAKSECYSRIDNLPYKGKDRLEWSHKEIKKEFDSLQKEVSDPSKKVTDSGYRIVRE